MNFAPDSDDAAVDLPWPNEGVEEVQLSSSDRTLSEESNHETISSQVK
jgi:hypothetical protein